MLECQEDLIIDEYDRYQGREGAYMGFQYRTSKTCAFGRWPPRTGSVKELSNKYINQRLGRLEELARGVNQSME